MMLCAGFKKEPEGKEKRCYVWGLRTGFHIQDEGDRRLYRKFQTYSLYAILYGESLCLPVELRDLAEDLFLWNPSIRELKNLPDSGRDVRTGACSYGFCYIECQNDYKNVEIGMGKFDDKIAHIHVYSLRNNSWKEIWKCPSICLTNHIKFVKGKLHWITGDGSDRNGMWFNPGDETFGNVALPNPSGDTFNWKLVSSAGNLCMTCDYRNKTHVWIMKEYGLAESWTIVASTPKFVNKVIWLIFSSQNDEILLLDISGLVWWYVSRDDDTFERPENQTLCECDGCGALSLYVESLVSPNSPFDR
ncbi:hypothetical protein T459_13441 [Capsicum annuum]|uniref:F-box associated beta-propeller type 1 domain-containing protein n=1 Tax=Capsicum annuum TaxID=4072 RepID=A0A2G2ZSN7_CAPAN|nr:hypothetical protein T459_13441 [Capsicum annuum]